MRTSDTLGKIAPALTKALAEIKNPEMTGVNPHFKKPYATLAHITCTIRPILAEHGLSVLQDVAEGPSVSTMIVHTSGEWIASDPLVMTPERQGPHGTMAAITYARRGSLCAMLNITGDEDDDGNSAMPKRSESGSQGAPRQSQPQDSGKMSDQKQQKRIYAKAKGVYPVDFSVFEKFMDDTYGTTHTRELTWAQADELIVTLIGLEKEAGIGR